MWMVPGEVRGDRCKRSKRAAIPEPASVTELAGYALEPLRVGAEFTLYRGREAGNGAPILVLTSNPGHQTPATIRLLEHEASLASELDPCWAARPLRLMRHDGQAMLMLEDPGGAPLSDSLHQPLELTRFLHVATGLAAAVGKVHHRGLIHKDIKPANVLVDAAGKSGSPASASRPGCRASARRRRRRRSSPARLPIWRPSRPGA